MREALLDLDEGADIVMVKPALAYLDVLRASPTRSPCRSAAYQISGEYAMIEAAAANGWIDRERAILESLTAHPPRRRRRDPHLLGRRGRAPAALISPDQPSDRTSSRPSSMHSMNMSRSVIASPSMFRPMQHVPSCEISRGHHRHAGQRPEGEDPLHPRPAM